MSEKTDLDRFAEHLRDVHAVAGQEAVLDARSARKSAALGRDAAKRRIAVRRRPTKWRACPSRATGSSSTAARRARLLRAIAEAAEVEPPAFGGVEGRGPDGSVIAISPFEPSDALYAFAVRRRGEETTFVHGYFYRTAGEMLERLSQKHGPAARATGRWRSSSRTRSGRPTARPSRRSPTRSSRALGAPGREAGLVAEALEFSVRLPWGESSEKAGMATSKRSPSVADHPVFADHQAARRRQRAAGRVAERLRRAGSSAARRRRRGRAPPAGGRRRR